MKLIIFQLCLGWIAVIGAPLIVSIVVVGSVLGDGISLSMIGRIFLMPLVFIWGLYQVRKYRAIYRANKELERGLEKDNGLS